MLLRRLCSLSIRQNQEQWSCRRVPRESPANAPAPTRLPVREPALSGRLSLRYGAFSFKPISSLSLSVIGPPNGMLHQGPVEQRQTVRRAGRGWRSKWVATRSGRTATTGRFSCGGVCEMTSSCSMPQPRRSADAACTSARPVRRKGFHFLRQPTMTANGERRHGTSTAKPARSNNRFSSASGTYTSSSAHDS